MKRRRFAVVIAPLPGATHQTRLALAASRRHGHIGPVTIWSSPRAIVRACAKVRSSSLATQTENACARLSHEDLDHGVSSDGSPPLRRGRAEGASSTSESRGFISSCSASATRSSRTPLPR